MRLSWIRNISYGLASSMFFLILLLFMTDSLFLAYLGVGYLVFIIYFHIRYWRCPNCNCYLGRSTLNSYCRNCGVDLRQYS